MSVPECLRILHYWLVLDALRNREDISRLCVLTRESLGRSSKQDLVLLLMEKDKCWDGGRFSHYLLMGFWALC